jgi:hypothetical protein
MDPAKMRVGDKDDLQRYAARVPIRAADRFDPRIAVKARKIDVRGHHLPGHARALFATSC